jgi:hypothetical protein
MDRKTMLKIFGEAFARSFAILLAIVILGFAAFFVIRVTSDKTDVAENITTEAVTTTEATTTEEVTTTEEPTTTEEVTTEEVTTEEPTTEVLDIPSTDKKIIVLNSTSVSGLAKRWSNKLVGAGFGSVVTGNYTAGAETQTKIYVAEEGMGNDLLGYFSDAEIVVGTPESGSFSASSGMSADGVEIYIVVGSGDTTVQ